MRGSKKSGDRAREKVPKWSKEAFNDKLRKVKCTLENKEDLRKNSSETGEREATAHVGWVSLNICTYNVAQSPLHPGEQEGAAQEQQRDR